MRKILALLVTFSLFVGSSASASSGGAPGMIIPLPLPKTSSVESEISGSKDFYISQEGHKVHWGGGIGIPENVSDDDYSLIVAFYDDGKLLHTDMNELDEDVTGFAFNEQILRLSYEPENLSAKAFLWNGASDFKPLCQAVNIKNVPYTTYYAKGRVVSTYKDGRVGKGEVELSLEYSENFDGQQIIDGDSTNIFATYTDEDINNHLFEYMDFAIAIDENDNAKVISYTPLDSNKFVTFSGESLVEYYEEEYILFEEDGTQTELELSSNCVVYVNGVECWEYDLFDLNLSASEIKVADVPDTGENFADGLYDFIFVDTYAWAVVEEVEITDETAKIYFSDYDTTYSMNAVMTIDFTDENQIVNIYKNDMSMAGIDEIRPGDTLYIKFDINDSLNYSMFADIIIAEAPESVSLFSTRNVSKYLDVYKVSSLPKLINNEDGFRIEGKFGLETFGDDLYDVIINVKSGSNVLYTKEFKADSRMEQISIYDELDFDPDSTMYMTVSLVHNGQELYPTVESDISDGYAEVIGRISEINGNEATVMIEKADDFFGQSYTYDDRFEIKADIDVESVLYACAKMKIEKKSGRYIVKSYNLYNTDVVELKTADFSYYDYNSIEFGDAYYRLSDDITAYVNGEEVNVDDAVEYYISDNTTGTVKLVDTPEYGYMGKDNRYDYMFITYIEVPEDRYITVGPDTSFAVVDSAWLSVNNVIDLYKDGEYITVETKEDVSKLERGMVIVYDMNLGMAENIRILFDILGISSDNEAISYSDAVNYTKELEIIEGYTSFNDNIYFKTGIEVWDDSVLSTPEGCARVGFGAIVDRDSWGVYIGQVEQAAEEIGNYISAGDYYSDNIDYYEFSRDMNVYIYDFNERDKTDYRLTTGAVGNIVKTIVPQSQLIENENGDYIYNWSEIDSVSDANYAYFKTLNGEITDILVIIPMEEW